MEVNKWILGISAILLPDTASETLNIPQQSLLVGELLATKQIPNLFNESPHAMPLCSHSASQQLSSSTNDLLRELKLSPSTRSGFVSPSTASSPFDKRIDVYRQRRGSIACPTGTIPHPRPHPLPMNACQSSSWLNFFRPFFRSLSFSAD